MPDGKPQHDWQNINARQWKCRKCLVVAHGNAPPKYSRACQGYKSPGELKYFATQRTGVNGSTSKPAGRCPYTTKPAPTLENVTLCITHFDRPDHLSRCVESIRRIYPTVAIIVGDNSIQARPSVLDDVRLLIAEPDCGLSALRNKLIANAETKYVAILEEDFVFTDETDLSKLVDVLDSDSRLGVAAGSLWTEGNLFAFAAEIGSGGDGKRYFHDKAGPYNVTARGTLWQRCGAVLNFFVARREILLANPWPDEIKIGDEHYRWFFDLFDRRACEVAHVPSVRAVHDRSGRSDHYQLFRRRRDWHKLGASIVQNGTQGGHVRGPLVVLGVGHSGTTIIAKMLAALGWGVHNSDPEYFEDRRVREVNAELLAGRRADPLQALQKLSPGWLIKDPRLVVTMPAWLEAFARTAPLYGPPLLVYIERNAEQVLASYRRRGESVDEFHTGYGVPELLTIAERRFQEWPYRKVRIRFEHLEAAVGLFRSITPPVAEESPRCKHLGEQLGEVPCGCGSVSKSLPVYKCSQFGQCTERASGKPQRWNGERIAACSGCELNPQFARRSSGA